MRTQHIRDLPGLQGPLGDREQRIAIAMADLQAHQQRDSAAAVATAVRYLEPTLVPVAAGVWLHNLMLLVR